MDKNSLAIEQILAQGDPALRWRAARMMRGESRLPQMEVIARQNADGGARCPFAETPVSSVGATSRMLCAMAFWGVGDSEECCRGVEFAWKHQQPDGRWTEAPVPGSSPPPWFMPGHLPVDLWVTANMVAALAALGYCDDPRLRKAIEWVERHVQPDGGFPGYIHTTFGMASVHYRMGAMDRAEPHLRHALAFLQPKSDIHDINWGLLCFYIGTVPKEHPTVTAYLDRLVDTQGEDGLWPTIYTDARQYLAMDALELLHAYRRL
ncbi:MAG: terpene cyclase/mutase family protein [Firmicutes bacterium]|jgi:squalene cyclase|nr:terpene cyclase/mutase family protein [Bacillota bacterium]